MWSLSQSTSQGRNRPQQSYRSLSLCRIASFDLHLLGHVDHDERDRSSKGNGDNECCTYSH